MNNKGGKICFQYADSGTCRFGPTCKYAHVEPGTEDRSRSSRQGPQGTRTHAKQKRRGKPKRRDHIGDFFAEYPEFDYDESAEIWREFYRMCDDFEWDKDHDERREARERFKSAMVLQFNKLYGTDEEDLNAWQIRPAIELHPPNAIDPATQSPGLLEFTPGDISLIAP
ncbi:hypothetical protein CLAIMM_00389 [Cladophialophora immunda]|nr:hypothetical protein CLAIMM_00389 [Cladophialophora immunda]